jgi:hypothetical protein
MRHCTRDKNNFYDVQECGKWGGGCGVDMPHHRRNPSELGVVVHEEFVGVGAQCNGNHVLGALDVDV